MSSFLAAEILPSQRGRLELLLVQVQLAERLLHQGFLVVGVKDDEVLSDGQQLGLAPEEARAVA